MGFVTASLRKSITRRSDGIMADETRNCRKRWARKKSMALYLYGLFSRDEGLESAMLYSSRFLASSKVFGDGDGGGGVGNVGEALFLHTNSGGQAEECE